MSVTRGTGAIVLAATSTLVAAGQQPSHVGQAPTTASTAQSPSFRATTTLVEVDAIVRDGSGRFVEGLTAADFTVFDEGEPQVIRAFSVVSAGSALSTPAAGPVAAPGDTTGPAASLTGQARVFVLVFDEDHIDSGAFKRLRSAAERFLNEHFRPGDIGGVLVGGRMSGNRLTTDREELLQAVKAAKPSGSAQTSRKLDRIEWPRVSDVEAVRIALAHDREVLNQVARRALQDDPSASRLPLDTIVVQKAQQMVNDMRPPAGRTVAAMKALVTGLAKVPGRKTVVLLTGGFFVEESWADLRQIAGEAARSNVRIYSVDSRGLGRRGNPTDLRANTPTDQGGSAPLEAYDTIEDGPNTLAMDTGGYVIRNANDFAGALAEIADDTSRYYVLGYTPAEPAAEGAYRRIEVRVNRTGVSVRARRGYVARPRPAPTSPLSAAPGRTTGAGAAGEESGTIAPPPSRESAPSAATEAPGATPAPVSTAPASSPSGLALRPDTSARVRELAERTAAPEAQGLASEGWSEYGRGNLEGARRLLAQAASEPGAAPWVSYALGFAELGLGRPEEAARAWERVRAAVPEFEAVYLDLADAHLQLDAAGSALEVLRAAERRWPADSDVLNALGTVQVRRGALGDAIETFQKAAAAQPGDALAYFNLGRTYELRYYQLRRFSRPTARWMDNPEDARKAVENYQRYLAIGGGYETEARAAIERLQWGK